MARHVTTEQQGEVVVVRVDRPPANALDPELLEDALDVLGELEADPPAALVLTGRDRFFCAGLDLKVVPALDPPAQAELMSGVDRLLSGFHAFPRPVVSAINGHAVAGGMVFALCGDRRVAAPDATFGLTEVRAGIPYPDAAMAIVRAELAPPAARRLVLGGELLDAEAALEMGAIDEIVAPERLLDRALEIARSLAQHPSPAYGIIKRELRAMSDVPLSYSGERHTAPTGTAR